MTTEESGKHEGDYYFLRHRMNELEANGLDGKTLFSTLHNDLASSNLIFKDKYGNHHKFSFFDFLSSTGVYVKTRDMKFIEFEEHGIMS